MEAADQQLTQLDDPDMGSGERRQSTFQHIRSSPDSGEDFELLRAVTEAIPDAVFVKDLQGRYRMINSAGAWCIGKSAEEIIGQDDSSLFSPESARDIIRRDREIMRTRQPQTFEEDSTADGITRTYLATKDVYCDAAGKVIGLIGIARDITERKRAEVALREAEEKYKAIFNDSVEGIFQTTPDGRFIIANPALARMHGFDSPEELIRERADISAQHYVTPAQREEFKRLLEEKGVVREFEYQAYRKDGSKIWVSDNVRAVRDEGGSVIYYEGTTQDITERKQAEERLRESEERYRELFENAKDAFYVHDLDGTYLSVNRAAEKLIGYPREEILGKNFADFFDAGQLKRLRESLCRKLTEQGETTYEAEVTARDGRLVPIEISSRLIYEDGAAIGVQGMARDVTERRRAEDALRATEHEQRQLAQSLEVERARLADAQAVAKVGSWELDLRNNVLTWSDETYRIFGLDRTRFGASYEAFLERIHPDDRAAVNSAYTESVANHRPYAIDHRMQLEDGSIKTVQERCHTYYDDEGRPIRSVGTCQDITQGKRAEEALRESEERFSKAFHSSPAALSIALLEDGRLMEVNASFLRITGYERDEVIGRTTLEIGLWASPDQRTTMYQALREQGEVADLEIQFRQKSGEIRDGMLAVELIELSGEPCVLAIVQDITERKRAEEQLKTREAQLVDAQRLAHIGNWERDLGSNKVTWSDEVYRIWRVKPEEFGGTFEAVFQLVHPDDRERFGSFIQKAFRDHRPFRFEHRIICPDGTTRILQARGAVVLDEGRNPIRMFGTSQDITERRQAEDEIKVTNNQLRALSARLQSAREEEGARISRELHDELGSALTSLNWDLQEIERALAGENRKDFSQLRKRLGSMTELVDTTIDTVRRISSELRPSVLDDLGLVEAIEWQAQQFQARTGITYHSDRLLKKVVHLSREQSTAVFRIFQEALTNILRHAGATRFTITIEEEAGDFALSVSDDGRGITENELSGPQSLGLLGMRERAHLIGGSVDIGGFKDLGTTVTVRLPLASVPFLARSPQAAGNGNRKSRANSEAN